MGDRTTAAASAIPFEIFISESPSTFVLTAGNRPNPESAGNWLILAVWVGKPFGLDAADTRRTPQRYRIEIPLQV
jgi:hypothetical protein